MHIPKDMDSRERVRVLFQQERWRTAPIQEIAEEAACARSIVFAVAKEMGLPPPHAQRHDKSLRLSPRERDLLAQIFETAARGGDVVTLLRSEPARNLHRVVIAARARA